MSNLSTAIKRLLAVAALAAAAIAVIVVIGTATGDDSKTSATPKKAAAGKKQTKKPKSKAKAYVVKEGDSLTVIAARTGVPVDRIEQLNPDLDPQALTIGQKLKLR